MGTDLGDLFFFTEKRYMQQSWEIRNKILQDKECAHKMI